MGQTDSDYQTSPNSDTSSDPQPSEQAALRDPGILAAFMEWSADSAILVEPGTGRCVLFNSISHTMLGYTRQEFEGITIQQFQAEHDSGKIRANIAVVMEGQTIEFESLHRRKDGSLVPVDVTLKRADHGGSTYLLAMIRDTSERKAREREQADRLRRLSLHTQLVGAISASERGRQGKIVEFASEVTEILARRLGLDRLTIWLTDPNGNFSCVDRYDVRTSTHRSAPTLDRGSLLVELETLKSVHYLDSSNAPADQRLASRRELSILPEGVRSLLDCCILSAGRLQGMISFEYLGREHRWGSDEIIFGCLIADQIGQALLNRERLEAVEALRINESLLKRAQAIAGIGHWILDLASGSITCSGKTCQIFNLPEGGTIAQEYLIPFIHSEDIQTVITAWKRCRNGFPYTILYRLIQAGQMSWIEERAEVEKDSAGRPIRVLGTVQDISEKMRNLRELERYREHLEEMVITRTTELEKAKLEAETANKAKSLFLSNMSHEIRTPMNAIIGFAHLLARDPLSSRQKEYLDKLGSSARHLLTIINDILDLSRIEANRITLESGSFSPESVFEQIRIMVAGEAAAKRLDLTMQLDSLPAQLLGDSTRFGQILLNLVGNAVKFTDKGSVSILCHASGSGEGRILLHVEICDTGIGLTTEQLSRIFHNFEQADPSTTRRFGGTGLGLAISKRLAELMGGTISVESEAGRGSCFKVDIPFRIPRTAGQTDFRTEPQDSCAGQTDSGTEPDGKISAEQAGAVGVQKDTQEHAPDLIVESQPEEALPAAFRSVSPLPMEKKRQLALRRGARILLAEDNDINREVFATLLESMGLSVSTAADGREALSLAETGLFDLIFMDIQMPVLGGFESTRAIRLLPHHHRTPILALTANAFVDDKKNFIAADMNEHLAKPVDLQGFTDAVLRWIPPNHSAGGQCPNEAAAIEIPEEISREKAEGPDAPITVPGIDERAGLRSTGGDNALFVRLVRRFGESHSEDASLIARAFEMGDIAELKLRTHTLKGVAATIGAQKIRDLAARLEQSINRSSGTPDAKEAIEELQASMRILCEAIARIPSDQEGQGEPAQRSAEKDGDCPDPKACIHELMCLLSESNALALRRFLFLRQWLAPVLGDRLPEIERHIRNFDFDEAFRLLQEAAPPSLRLDDIASCEDDTLS